MDKILQFFGGLVLRCIETEEITPKIGAKIDEVEKTIASIAKKKHRANMLLNF